jgi:hypothetical protein
LLAGGASAFLGESLGVESGDDAPSAHAGTGDLMAKPGGRRKSRFRRPSLAICCPGSIGAIRKKPGDQLRLADGLALKTLANCDSLTL